MCFLTSYISFYFIIIIIIIIIIIFSRTFMTLDFYLEKRYIFFKLSSCFSRGGHKYTQEIFA